MRKKNLFNVIFVSLICGLLSGVFSSAAFSFSFFGHRGKSNAKTEGNVLSQSAESKPLTLEEAYRLTLVQSEDIAIKREELNKAQGRLYQALNEVIPEVSFLMTESIQDAPKEAVAGSSSLTGNLLRRATPQKKFTLHQPIFSGFKEVAGIQGSNAEKAQKLYERIRLEQTLLTDVVSVFYAVISSEKDIKILEETRQTIEDRIKELEARVVIGRSRESEVQTALSDKMKVEAQLILSRRDVVLARQQLEYFIGRPVEGPLAEPEGANPKVKEPDDYLDRLDSRPDVKAAHEAYLLAEQGVVAAQSGLFPRAYLDGNYYTQRVGTQSGIDWDVLLSVNVPVFNGTETIGTVKAAAAEREIAKYNFFKTKRMGRLEISAAYEEYRSAILEDAALGEAARAKKKDYELQTADYQSNLVSNLDVLTALKDTQDLNRQANAAHTAAKINYWRLKAAVGEVRIKETK
ncbi:MAG: hypothetical protein COT00_03205 [Candidatus Omnitrophica bacterium CG07_land_8_20_14_0_80_50_8]|nr:MAG: hypothetical protein AUJ71_04115 [Candidatus Omnitrophica bacterium CG1_02_49_16]PIU40142.1 MAG: hypothetical protein COT00_03205 [Candidatus Omnitrophica bacterium CG07_land_8_20_14_0_80_50_8]